MFRIDYVLPRSEQHPDAWAWSVKIPNGLYETLVTNVDGSGIYIRNMSSAKKGEIFDFTQLIPDEEFNIPANVTKDQSINLLEIALNGLCWGQDFIVLLKQR